MDLELSKDWPTLVTTAGPNGAGKSQFYKAHLAKLNLPFINADVIAAEQQMSPYEAAAEAGRQRSAARDRRESFVFETVFSDPVGDKVNFLKESANMGYQVVLCFIGIQDVSISRRRVGMRVSQGGHDVPDEKLDARFERSLANLRRAIDALPHVFVYDNSNLDVPYRMVAVYRDGQPIKLLDPAPAWFEHALTL